MIVTDDNWLEREKLVISTYHVPTFTNSISRSDFESHPDSGKTYGPRHRWYKSDSYIL